MNVFDIDTRIAIWLESHTDEETGELTGSADELAELQMERRDALEGIALAYKNYTANVASIKAEVKVMKERQEVAEHRAERLKSILESALDGEKLETGKVSVSFRKNAPSVSLDMEKFMSWATLDSGFLRAKEPEPDKMAIKEALKEGVKIPGAELVSKRSCIIK